MSDTAPLHSGAHHTDTFLTFGQRRGHSIYAMYSSHDLTSMRGLENAVACAEEWWGSFFLTDAPVQMSGAVRLRDVTEVPSDGIGTMFAAATQRLRERRCPRSPQQGRLDAWNAKYGKG